MPEMNSPLDLLGSSPKGVILLAGATAVGKSAVAIELARQLNGEIISVDSMQVYRGLDLGTAKPASAERAQVPHHLIDVADLSQEFNAAAFANQARAVFADIVGRNALPILCGGTGFYFEAFLGGLGSAPSGDPALRAQLDLISLEDLLKDLENSDPVCFRQIDRQNRRRVSRAVEVIRISGRPYSSFQSRIDHAELKSRIFMCGLRRTPGDLRHRIESRVDQMFAAGLIQEVEALKSQGLEQNQVASQAIGYRQLLDPATRSLPADQLRELVKMRTWQFARRQMTWFKRKLPLLWLAVGAEDTAQTTAKRMASAYQEWLEKRAP